MAARLWIDVEDLFEYALSNSRPSGVQRLAFELYRTLEAEHGNTGLVRFVRHDPMRNGLRAVPWSDVAALFTRLTSGDRPPPARRTANRLHAPAWGFLRRLLHRVPPTTRVPLIEALRKQADSWRAWVRLIGTIAASARQVPARLARRPASAAGRHGSDFANLAAAGDWLLALGAPWSHPDYAGMIDAQRRQRGLRFALLVYDLIPTRHPEWCEGSLARLFWNRFDDVLRLCDAVFAISRATAADVAGFARERGIALPGAVVPVPIGTGFGAGAPPNAAVRTRRLPPPGSYALFVSTIEARKNHILLFRVWQRLVAELPRAQVPVLVFAGRVGWLVDDLMRQIANTGNLDGHLLVIENPTDAELTALYQGCLFTLFPSFYEGWGLPVTESLAFGKPCLIADRTSLPEAGGDLVRRFDPDNLHDAYREIRAVIDDPAGLARWEERVRREFRPVPWSATVAALLAGLGHPLADVSQECYRSDPVEAARDPASPRV